MNKDEFVYFAQVPERMAEVWDWVIGLSAWEYGDPSLLTDLIKKEPIPPEFTEAVSDIISGSRTPKNKAAAKLKVPAAQRIKVAAYCQVFIGVYSYIKNPSLDGTGGASEIADRSGIETHEVVSTLQSEVRNQFKEVANNHGVSVETIENLVRDLRKRINQWPVV